jgi:ribonuclease P protein component
MSGEHAGYGAACRLRRGKDFDRLFAVARSHVGRTMVLRALESAAEVSRCGVVASKRTFRRAVDRNRAKRLLREAFRLERASLPCTYDFVLVARKSILDGGIQAVREDFCNLATRLQQMDQRGRSA